MTLLSRKVGLIGTKIHTDLIIFGAHPRKQMPWKYLRKTCKHKNLQWPPLILFSSCKECKQTQWAGAGTPAVCAYTPLSRLPAKRSRWRSCRFIRAYRLDEQNIVTVRPKYVRTPYLTLKSGNACSVRLHELPAITDVFQMHQSVCREETAYWLLTDNIRWRTLSVI